jgi:hypothetical protein
MQATAGDGGGREAPIGILVVVWSWARTMKARHARVRSWRISPAGVLFLVWLVSLVVVSGAPVTSIELVSRDYTRTQSASPSAYKPYRLRWK